MIETLATPNTVVWTLAINPHCRNSVFSVPLLAWVFGCQTKGYRNWCLLEIEVKLLQIIEQYTIHVTALIARNRGYQAYQRSCLPVNGVPMSQGEQVGNDWQQKWEAWGQLARLGWYMYDSCLSQLSMAVAFTMVLGNLKYRQFLKDEGRF